MVAMDERLLMVPRRRRCEPLRTARASGVIVGRDSCAVAISSPLCGAAHGIPVPICQIPRLLITCERMGRIQKSVWMPAMLVTQRHSMEAQPAPAKRKGSFSFREPFC